MHWWTEKEGRLYVLNIALLLAVLHGFNVELKPNSSIWSFKVEEEKFNLMNRIRLDSYEPKSYFEVQKLRRDFQNKNDSASDNERIMEINNSGYASHHLRNITVNMVLVSSMDFEDNHTLASLQSVAEEETNMNRDGFNFENMEALQGWNNTHNYSDISNSTNNIFTNGDDVRWRQFLNIENTSTSQKHCDSTHCAEKDISKSDSFNSISFGNFFNEQSTSKDLLDVSDIFYDPFDSVAATDLNIPSTSHDKTVSSSVVHHPLSLNAAGKEDSDLMQMLYEQDADLGYNNWRQSEPIKQLKDVNDIQKMKNDLPDANYFIDGETGEQILIPSDQITQQQTTTFAPYQSPVPASNNNASNAINLEECLEILEHSIDDMGPTDVSNQTSVVEQNNVIRNLNSLLDANGNTSSIQAPTNPDLWQQIDELEEMTGLNLREISQPQNEMNGNFNYDGQMPAIGNMNQQPNYNSMNFDGTGQASGNSPSYGSPVFSQAFPATNFPAAAQSPPVSSSPSYVSPPLISDDGIPMDTTFSPMGSPEKQEPNFPLNDFSNFNYNTTPLGEGNSALSSLPEPGQSFFDYLQPESSVAADFVPATSTLTSFSSQTNTPFLNPPVASYNPPPLNQNVSSAGFMDIASTVDKNVISESYESDSGISLDQSPRGLEFLTLTSTDDNVYNADVSMIKTEPNDHDQSFVSDLKAIHHNHTYNGTVGMKKQEKPEKPSLPRESRDEKKARELNLPFSLDEIILSPVEEYNEMLARTPLTPAQQTLIKDIRRRGKNKVAAQNCRKRKIETITSMEEDVELMRSKKQQLVDEQKALEMKYENVKLKYSSLYHQIFSSLRDDAGRPYDPSRFRLEQVEGAVLLVPNMGQVECVKEDGTSSSTEVEYSKVKVEKRQ